MKQCNDRIRKKLLPNFFIHTIIKQLSIFLFLIILSSFAPKTNNVLLYIRGDGLRSADLEFMLEKEIGVMTEIFDQSEINVVIASISGEPIETQSMRVVPDIKLSNVNISDYSGILLSCMADSSSAKDVASAVTLVKNALKADIPIAAQFGAIEILAYAGGLKDKKYAFYKEVDVNQQPEFKGGIYSGTGVIQDGRIITSSACPFWARMNNVEDGTRELTELLIKTIKTEK